MAVARPQHGTRSVRLLVATVRRAATILVALGTGDAVSYEGRAVMLAHPRSVVRWAMLVREIYTARVDKPLQTCR